MAKKKTTWTNKKAKGVFKGNYRKIDGDREFILTRDEPKKTYSFESHEMAKAQGWKIQK